MHMSERDARGPEEHDLSEPADLELRARHSELRQAFLEIVAEQRLAQQIGR